MGFCLYNNVAIAARYARATYPEMIRRVLIVDFDVHHGNGTQEIFCEDPAVYYLQPRTSIHGIPGRAAPMSAVVALVRARTLNIPIQARTASRRLPATRFARD
jgi:acetoin utilization deacetylase AcuC-like enzyme